MQTNFISTSLKTETDVSTAKKINANSGYSFEACKLAGKGFVVTKVEAEAWIKSDPINSKVLKPMMDGRSLINPFEEMDWVIDFNEMSIEEASEYIKPFERIQQKLKAERMYDKNIRKREKWWLFERSRPAMRKALEKLPLYFCLTKHSKFVVFSPVDILILPCEANIVIASNDFYVLGIITSSIHKKWAIAQSSTLEDRIRYTNTTCFETFPFPQLLSQALIEKIRKVTQDLHHYRLEIMEKRQWGLTKLYNAFFDQRESRLYKLHAELDSLVMKAYGFNTGQDFLERLLELNQELVAKEQREEPVIGAWAPTQETNENIDYSIACRLRRKARQA